LDTKDHKEMLDHKKPPDHKDTKVIKVPPELVYKDHRDLLERKET
jgi:hypothetical protein